MEKKRRKTLREYAMENNMEYLIDEWDEDANGITVDEAKAWDTNRRHWKLPYHDNELNKDFVFKWESTPSKRCRGSNCPILSNQMIHPGYNDLQTRNPELAKELHPTLNGVLTADKIAPNSNKKIWWLCPSCGYEYQATPSHRNICKTGCPRCAKELQTSFPEYALLYYLGKHEKNIKHSFNDLGFELDIYMPDLKIAVEYDGSHWHEKKVKQDLEKNRKCEELGIKLYRLRANLESLNDSSIYIKCSKNSKSLNNAIEILIKDIFNIEEEIDVDKNRCEIEKDRIFRRKENSLAVVRPDLAAEWHPTKNGLLRPDQIHAQSNKMVWWLKEYYDEEKNETFYFEWQCKVNNRYHGDCCGFLTGKRVLLGYNDLASNYPDLAKQWSPKNKLKPTQVSCHSQKKILWVIEYFDPILNKTFNLEWVSSVSDRVNGNGCPYLSGKKLLVGFNDLGTRYPEIAKEWNYKKNNGLTPQDFMSASSKKVYWIHHHKDLITEEEFDFEWIDSIAHRTIDKRGCPILSGHQIHVGYNDLASRFPKLAKQLDPNKNHGIEATNILQSTAKKLYWKCPHCGISFERSVVNMTKRTPKCPNCKMDITL